MNLLRMVCGPKSVLQKIEDTYVIEVLLGYSMIIVVMTVYVRDSVSVQFIERVPVS